MAHTRLIKAVCTVAMLAAAPAWAQSNNPPAAPAAPGTAPSNMAPSAAPSGSMDNGTGKGTMNGHMTHRSAMSHGSMHGAGSATSQDAAVDRLNEQSYQAAQQGQAFSTGGSGSMSQPPASGNMNGAPSGTMPAGTMPPGSNGGKS